MIRPWYRSRLFWLGVPGLVFLLWVWWDSGGYSSECLVHDGRSEMIAFAKAGDGSIRAWARADVFSNSPTFYFDRLEKPADEVPSSHHPTITTYRARQFDLPPAVSWRINKDEALGEDPAADGWVPSPGATLPKPELKSVEVEVALWLIILAYLSGMFLTMLWWQRRKARLLKATFTPAP